MPRLTKAVPKYRKHRASGQAIVTLDGRDFYLGPHGTAVSKMEYDRLVAEWLANGRRFPSASADVSADDWTIVELLAAYRRFAQSYYVKNGRVTNEYNAIKSMMRLVRRLYGRELVSLALAAQAFYTLAARPIFGVHLKSRVC